MNISNDDITALYLVRESESLRTLLKAGSTLNTSLKHSALKGHIATMFYNGNDLKEVCLLLLAAGEKLDATAFNAPVPIPDYLLFKDLQLNLKHLCREAIRKHLLKLDPHTHLFSRVPRLGLPSMLAEYSLYDMSLDTHSEDKDGNDNYRPSDDIDEQCE